ncbi:MAG: SGNH/GDSL hydrolase family protein, partial [Parasporobacterium sp.]|nr:SGNH/GDSL hydrolase family protein [Parasporobacterium sp.]
ENAGFPAPLTKNRYEYSRRIRSVPGPESSHIHLEGFEPDTEFQDGVADCFKHGWTAVKTGAQIAFDVNACCIGVHFRRTISLPAPIAAVVIDGKESEAIILDANFGETWGDKAELATILEEDADHMHHVSIRIMETHENDRKPFYLIALTVAARKQ